MEERSNVVLNMHAQQDFLAYCTRPVSVHLAMVCVGCSFDSFSIFLLTLKQQQNLMVIMFSCVHFPIWPYPPKIFFLYFILVNCMGWQICIVRMVLEELPPYFMFSSANTASTWDLHFFSSFFISSKRFRYSESKTEKEKIIKKRVCSVNYVLVSDTCVLV